MLTFNPSSLRTSLGDSVAPFASSGAATNGFADPAGFASLLRQSQAAPAPAPMPAPAAPPPAKASSENDNDSDNDAGTDATASKDSPDEAPAPQESEATSRARALQRGKLRAADGTAGSNRAGKPTLDTGSVRDARDSKTPASTETGPGGDCLAPETKSTAADTPIDPSMMQWLADQQRIAINTDLPRGNPGGKDRAETSASLALPDTALIESSGAAKLARAAELKADADLKDQAAAHGKAPLAEAAVTAPFAAALKEQGLAEKPAVKAADTVKDLAAIGASATLAAPTGGNEAAPPAAVPIATPVTAPDFAQELGLRLSVLAKDGVQTAELHLNPADMGPVSVQIVMDGTQARVDFGADMAATRQAIEAGLPELASALRDAGFTLAGGGVSQHAGGRSGGGGSPSSGRDDARRVVADKQLQRVATAARRIVAQGGVDVFA